jgi:Ca2+-binding EF-hand superfamily protein
MISIQRMREILWAESKSLSDEEIFSIITNYKRLARLMIRLFEKHLEQSCEDNVK